MCRRPAPSAFVVSAVLLSWILTAQALNGFLDQFTKQSTLTLSGTAGPAGVEGNPYGFVPIPTTLGKLTAGNYLITNWNSADGINGQGHTIVQLSPNGTKSIFATIPNNPPPAGCRGPKGSLTQVGLTMALVVLKNGWVLAGDTPIQTAGGVASKGCIILLDFYGNIRSTLSSDSSPALLINGPWGGAVKDQGNSASVFFSMVLGANASAATPQTGAAGGYVVRYDLTVPAATPQTSGKLPSINKVVVVASGFSTAPGVSDTNAGIEGGTVGPSGIVHDPVGAGSHLYIADTLNSAITFVMPSTACTGVTLAGAGIGNSPCAQQMLTSGSFINTPIGLSLLPNGNVLASNGGIGSLVEVAPGGTNQGTQISARLVDNVVDGDGNLVGQGNLFNAVAGTAPNGHPRIYFVDDNFNNVQVLDL